MAKERIKKETDFKLYRHDTKYSFLYQSKKTTLSLQQYYNLLCIFNIAILHFLFIYCYFKADYIL